MAKQFAVQLIDRERDRLAELVRNGEASDRKVMRARILLMAHDGIADGKIAVALHVSVTTIRRLRKQFVEQGIDAALGQPSEPKGQTESDNGLPPPAEPLRAGEPVCGVQWTGTVEGNAERQYRTFNWPAAWHVVWTMAPTVVGTEGPQLSWQVSIERADPDYVTYWIRVKNLAATPVAFEGRYAILGQG